MGFFSRNRSYLLKNGTRSKLPLDYGVGVEAEPVFQDGGVDGAEVQVEGQVCRPSSWSAGARGRVDAVDAALDVFADGKEPRRLRLWSVPEPLSATRRPNSVNRNSVTLSLASWLRRSVKKVSTVLETSVHRAALACAWLAWGVKAVVGRRGVEDASAEVGQVGLGRCSSCTGRRRCRSIPRRRCTSRGRWPRCRRP